jgi:hypothetical protein
MVADKVSDRRWAEILVVVDENNAGVACLRHLACKVKPAKASDIARTMVNHYRNPRRCCCGIYQAALTAVVPDEHLYSDFLGGELLQRVLQPLEPVPNR